MRVESLNANENLSLMSLKRSKISCILIGRSRQNFGPAAILDNFTQLLQSSQAWRSGHLSKVFKSKEKFQKDI